MYIAANTTGMQAAVTMATDKHARDYCVVVVKGTFDASPDGELRLAQQQRPPQYVDEHYGDPEGSPIRYESDFAPTKTSTDVIVVGKAVAPRNTAVSRLTVRLEVGERIKEVVVFGERRWTRSARGLVASQPSPFQEIPLTFDRAFGGLDDSRGAAQIAAERRNLVGVGFHHGRGKEQIVGTLLPNLENPRELLSSPYDRPPPAGFGVIGRSWRPRVDHAGTYDEKWRDDICPLLPPDFDERYFQAAPLDQQFPLFRGEETIRCVHMARERVVPYRIPKLRLPVVFRFIDGERSETSVLDTVILEPHRALAVLVWRARIALGRKPNALRCIFVGDVPSASDFEVVGFRDGKPIFSGLGAAVRWLRGRRGSDR